MVEIQFPDFMAVTFGLVTYLLGEAVNDRVGLLRRLSIPDPVTGGLIVAAVFYALHAFGVVEIGWGAITVGPDWTPKYRGPGDIWGHRGLTAESIEETGRRA